MLWQREVTAWVSEEGGDTDSKRLEDTIERFLEDEEKITAGKPRCMRRNLYKAWAENRSVEAS